MPRSGRFIAFYGGNYEFEYSYLLEEGKNKLTVPVNSYYYILYESNDYIDQIMYRNSNITYLELLRNNGLSYNPKHKAKIKSINRLGYDTANKKYPEQSLIAYKEAIKAGFDILLCDLSFTSDNIPVCFHDNTINRIARNSDGSALSSSIVVNEHTYDELSKYDYGIYAGSEFSGTKLLTLDEFLCFAKAVNVEVYIEIKYMSKRSWAKIAVDTVKKHHMLDNVSWASHFSENAGQMWVPSRILENDSSARVALMTNGNGMTSEYKSALLALKTDRNEIFAFNWNSEKLTDNDIDWLTSNNISYEVGIIDTENDIISYYTRDDVKYIISGIESNKIVASDIIKKHILG